MEQNKVLKPQLKVDYSIFERKMGNLGTKVIPRAKITVEQIARYGHKAVKLFTLRGKGRGSRTSGRQKIANLWTLTHKRKAYMDVFTIYNLYPKQQVIIFFEEGTRPHEISPRKKKVLHWITEAGEDIFTKKVHDHPGMPPTKMVERTEREVIDPRIKLWMTKTLAMVDKEMR